MREQLKAKDQQAASMEADLAAAQAAEQAAARLAQQILKGNAEQKAVGSSEQSAKPSTTATTGHAVNEQEGASASNDQLASKQEVVSTPANQPATENEAASASHDANVATQPAEASYAMGVSYRHLLQEVAALRQKLRDSSIDVVAGTVSKRPSAT